VQAINAEAIMAKDSKGHGSDVKGAAYSRQLGREAGAAGKSLRSLMKSKGVLPGTKTALHMSAGHMEGRNSTRKADGRLPGRTGGVGGDKPRRSSPRKF
jgi:hypothetical protein